MFVKTYEGNALGLSIKLKSRDGSPFLIPAGDALVFTIKRSPTDPEPLVQVPLTGDGSDSVIVEVGAEALQIAPGWYFCDLFDSTLKRTLLPPYLFEIKEVLYYD